MEEFITVSELNYYLINLINNDGLLYNVCLVGEVSSIFIRQNTAYLTLKDDMSQINAIVFNVDRIYMPSVGEQIMVVGKIDLYLKNGGLSLIIKTIKPYGKGKLYQEFLILKEKLEKEGLFEESVKKEIPKYPFKIGVATSFNGAVIQDILSTIRNKNLISDIIIYDTKVQGISAEDDIVSALQRLDIQELDVIILARGGGSVEDLAPFNSEKVARAIFAANTPIVSAIGHETDYTISDFVADLRALTPTAAAELVAFDVVSIKEHILSNLSSQYTKISYKLFSYTTQVKNNLTMLKNILYNRLTVTENQLKQTIDIIKLKANHIYNTTELQLNSQIQLLSSLNPANIMLKGYFGVSQNGHFLNTLSKLAIGDTIQIIGNKELCEAKIIAKNKE